MNMKLALKDTRNIGAARASQWSFERGRRVIGRSRDCDWQIDDNERRVSKLHCTLSRDGEGFTILDQSANGTLVDGRLLLEGESARLRDGSQINIGGQVFQVAISGDAELDFSDPDASLRMSDEPLTISAILADIAPNGRSAGGVMGNTASADDWSETWREGAKRKAKSISRNVEIGWSEPPSARGIGAVLPDNWDEEPVASSEHEHTDALNTPVMISRPVSASDNEDFDSVFPEAGEDLTPEGASAAGASTAQEIGDLLTALEQESADCLAILDIEGERTGHGSSASLSERMETLIRQQRRLAASLETLIHGCTQKLEPRLLEASVDAGNDLRAKIERRDWQGLIMKTDYWSTYKKQFEENGRPLPVRQFLQRAARGEAAPTQEPDAITADAKGVNNHDET
ncbi:forkhead-associated protein [Agrobacterium sp. TS43]|uniref:type VI secretion system-associated FHA domain protein n=1 Tax=Agrobacterium TaxID=357 RepID=UPI00036FB9AB|nr:forkhead-associated protein [Agrobacterium radiobacter DSM 30147]KDR87675.1 forkhead-associated protein [Agrobacterium tumefaciens GW4]KVK50898.1 forkhead-associated protein [Agrobacterium sp. JL28]KVK51077.1 forkhead-associated protein [Agrobacterium sp. LY4]KVK55604.1 forkhead-associated protein [Agrobacterium sp. TS43]KVK63343.1 forkhead-associated protein [Agrobacterium sp. TS45]KVK67802.1 forkhead-associated protein [Agrobacterium sp. C13]